MTEQLSLFDTPKPQDEFATFICKEFNKLDTVWEGTFVVTNIDLSKWENISDPLQVLSITLKPDTSRGYLTYLEGDEESKRIVSTVGRYSELIGKLMDDKDFAISITPWCIFVFYHKFKKKTKFLKELSIL